MKIRNGFVSNSSSSSFVIACKEEDHKKAFNNLHPYFQKWIRKYLRPEKQKFAGQDIVVFSIHISSEDEEPIEWDIKREGKYPQKMYLVKSEAKEYDDYVPGAEIVYKYIEELKKISEDIIYNEESF